MLDLMTGMARTVFVYGNPGSEGNPPVQGKPPAQIATENRGGERRDFPFAICPGGAFYGFCNNDAIMNCKFLNKF